MSNIENTEMDIRALARSKRAGDDIMHIIAERERAIIKIVREAWDSTHSM